MLFYDFVLQLTPASISFILSHSQPELPHEPPQAPLVEAVAEVKEVSKQYPLFSGPFDRLRQLWRPAAAARSASKAALSDISLQIYLSLIHI